LATLLLSEDTLHVQAIADRTELPYSVVQREVDRLERANLVVSQRFAGSRVVRTNDRHPYYPELRALLIKAYGPRELLADLFENVRNIEESYLFGSWAARYLGEWGDAPADIDVLVVGEPDRPRIEELEAEAEDRLGRPVQITVVSPREWRRPTSGVIRTIKKRPLVRLDRGL
jgi:predicted nucleotidyltransferase